jgi:Common central domain of tyrosinase
MKTKLIFFIIFCWSQQIFAQRQDVNTMSATDQSTLACNIKTLLDNYHEDLVHRHTALTIHTADNFFVWHKFYIHKVEKYLHSNFNAGSFESAPQPYWNPLNPIPNAFFNTGSGGIPACDRANDVPDNPLPPHGTAGHIHEIHTATFLPLQFQNINTVAGGLSGRFNNTFNGITTKQFYNNVFNSNTYTCQFNSRTALTNFIGPGGGHHGNVHLAIGGCLGGSFHEAPGSTLFSVWHSYLDKVWHDWECNCNQISGSDLYIADRENDDDMTSTTHNGIDMGYEPNEAPATYPMWISDDIWVRNQPDGIQYQEHENPEYETGKKVYVYVRVRNRGCAISSGNEEVKLYWGKANTALDWPLAWNGGNTLCSNPSGGQIGASQVVIPLQPDGYKIYVFEFTLPKPSDYACVGQINHFCLLARITDASKANEGMTFAETNDVYANTRNNNNIAWKNISILDDVPNQAMMMANIAIVRSITSKNEMTKILFKVPFVLPKHRGEETNILKYTRVSIKLDPKLYDAWKRAKIEPKGMRMDDKGVMTMLENNVEIPLMLKEKENYTFQMMVQKPRKMPKYLPELKFDVIQMDGKRVIGGQRFVIPVNKYKTIKDMYKK